MFQSSERECPAETVVCFIDGVEQWARYALHSHWLQSLTRFNDDRLFSHSDDQYEYFFPHRSLSWNSGRPRLLVYPAADVAAAVADDDDDDDDVVDDVWHSDVMVIERAPDGNHTPPDMITLLSTHDDRLKDLQRRRLSFCFHIGS